MRFDAHPDGDGIVAIHHRLGTWEPQVRCERSDGSNVGYRFINAVSPDDVEVATVPLSGVSTIIVEAREEPE